ncbi:RNA polymerase-associated protein RapA [Legionella bononiensis]|uniref:RNA polymerase-associated protein RapA n=1 Tax=Legionella bononiensis TaxID=2793102 RepID=A0ABS1WB17_9GAMM|nr:RNA polymerase-associated protein RapA [Legionella bononiensis]MBL7480212.1 RNA polymerase-associated protein RapA [Legionella bononiensis]MBL7526556.1 RNA polymerase-associated protein RapA [Legionella bononiensis]MBL7562950.1 RNA polymerase-associated protein RapA [Legionella bononiensis]
MTFTIGQRWISNTESQLGLGIITELHGRHVSISFPAAEEDRIYAIDNAPLSRIIYKIGEEICTNDDQKLHVTEINDLKGLIIYTAQDAEGKEHQINELALNCFITLSTPQQRLFSGLLDKLNAFKLRIDTLNHTSRLQQSKVRGLLGSRTNHLPHQVYIASEIAQRYAPRVLLADEVGLGKTIEAGMILHYQLHTGRASRVLIIVPDSLIHQWLVEMIRRFNLYFSIFDKNRFELMKNDEVDDNDEDDEDLDRCEPTSESNFFEMEQLVLCSLDFLMSNEEARKQAIEAQWDLLIVDEAHHLHWSEELPSPEYQFVEQLSAQSKGLLLLTATPEQIGIQSHFARLRLLDPSRFYDLNLFKKEEEGYQKVNALVQKLIAYKETEQTDELNTELKSQLVDYLGKDISNSINTTIKNLLDRHGTGRVLFRNTRAAIKGFPERNVHQYPLTNPALYAALNAIDDRINLYPESQLNNDIWLLSDPRVQWLASKIDELHPQKVLIICAKAKTALALEQFLKLKAGIRSTAFHEGLTIIERDRAAAYFAEQEQGAQALVCSEIGSEGRNFQFAHHLVLFDLPLNPDLLEQRIGRLDRIGQKNTIEIHIPYLVNTAQEILFRWYHEGINLLKQSCSVGFSIYEQFKHQLLPILQANNIASDPEPLNRLIDETKIYTDQINQMLHEGRDRLLELNSCNPVIAQELIAEIEAEESSIELENYMAKVFHEFGIDHEYHSELAEILRPTDHMKTTHFPGLKEDGITVTYSRTKALIREDMEFLSWEHPMVNDSMEMILNSETGNATLTTISVKSIAPGTLFLETFYTVNCAAPKHLQLDRFLPFIPIRILMDLSGKNLSKILDYNQLNAMCEPVKRHLGYPIIKQVSGDIESILKNCNHLADQQMKEVIEQAKIQMIQSIGDEVSRLESLQKINPTIRNEEIEYFKQQIVECEHYINSAALKLQALRVVINK